MGNKFVALAAGKGKIEYPCLCEPKFDGVRTIALIDKKGEVTTWSRTNKRWVNFRHIEAGIKKLKLKDVMLDGEVMGEDFEETIKISRIGIKRRDERPDDKLIYHVFDMLPLDVFVNQESDSMSQLHRSRELSEYLAFGHPDNVKFDAPRVINNEKELNVYYEELVAQGLEGMMIKKYDAPYKFGRSTTWLKMKPTETLDCRILDIEEALDIHTHEPIGMLGALWIDVDGHKCKAGPGKFTHPQRKEYWENRATVIGQYLEVSFQERTKDGALRFANAVRLRGMEKV